MSVKLSDEQRQALEQAPQQAVLVEDQQNRKLYYLLDAQAYLHLEGLRSDQEQRCHEQLRQLIDEGIQSPGVPADEAFVRLRSFADQLSRSAP